MQILWINLSVKHSESRSIFSVTDKSIYHQIAQLYGFMILCPAIIYVIKKLKIPKVYRKLSFWLTLAIVILNAYVNNE